MLPSEAEIKYQGKQFTVNHVFCLETSIYEKDPSNGQTICFVSACHLEQIVNYLFSFYDIIVPSFKVCGREGDFYLSL